MSVLCICSLPPKFDFAGGEPLNAIRMPDMIYVILIHSKKDHYVVFLSYLSVKCQTFKSSQCLHIFKKSSFRHEVILYSFIFPKMVSRKNTMENFRNILQSQFLIINFISLANMATYVELV